MRVRFNFQPFTPVVSLFLMLAAIAIPRIAFGQAATSGSKDVWFWFGDYRDARAMAGEILVDGKVVYRLSFRACRMQRNDDTADKEQKKELVFHFPGGHTFQDTYYTSTREEIEGNVWQAGADPDDMLLGVSFVAHNQILLNTIHIVRPGKPGQSTLDPGIVMRTYPLKPASVKTSAWKEAER